MSDVAVHYMEYDWFLSYLIMFFKWKDVCGWQSGKNVQGSSHSWFHGTGNWLASHSGCCVCDDFGSSAVQGDNINNLQNCTQKNEENHFMEFRLTVYCHNPEEHILTFKQPMFAYVNTS